jgi:hypothetical protein
MILLRPPINNLITPVSSSDFSGQVKTFYLPATPRHGHWAVLRGINVRLSMNKLVALLAARLQVLKFLGVLSLVCQVMDVIHGVNFASLAHASTSTLHSLFQN